MSVRIRLDGRILCAALHPAEPGDTYLPDNVTEVMSGATGNPPVIVTEPWELPPGVGRGGHKSHGEWWWLGSEPADAVIDRPDTTESPEPCDSPDEPPLLRAIGLTACLSALLFFLWILLG